MESHFTLQGQNWTREAVFMSVLWIPYGCLLSAWRNPIFEISRVSVAIRC